MVGRPSLHFPVYAEPLWTESCVAQWGDVGWRADDECMTDEA